jgi:periplasmic copper chaperone A
MNRRTVSVLRPLARLGVLGLAVATLLALGTGLASAHVTVSSTDAAPGGYGLLTFRVPNESDTASTIAVRIQIPKDAPLASLSTQPVPGWKVIRTQSKLAKPITVEGQEITSYDSVIEFRAAAGGGIGPGEFQEFRLSGGPFPDTKAMTFNVVQSCSDGSESAWIEPTVAGQPEPEHPAPVLTLSSSSSGSSSHGSAPTGDTSSASSSSSAPAWVALAIAIVALVAAVAGCVLAWRASRRTVSS